MTFAGTLSPNNIAKTILTDKANFKSRYPSRNNEFEPQIVKKHQQQLERFDDKISLNTVSQKLHSYQTVQIMRVFTKLK